MSTSQRLKRVDDLATRTDSLLVDLRSLIKAGGATPNLQEAGIRLAEARHWLADEMAATSDSATGSTK